MVGVGGAWGCCAQERGDQAVRWWVGVHGGGVRAWAGRAMVGGVWVGREEERRAGRAMVSKSTAACPLARRESTGMGRGAGRRYGGSPFEYEDLRRAR